MHDSYAIAAQFEGHTAQSGRRLDFGADAGGAGEGDEIDARVAHQLGPDAIAIEHVEHAGRGAGVDENPRQFVNDAGRLRRCLQNQRVSGRDRRGDLMAGEVYWRVERRDSRYHADWKTQHEADLAGAHGAGVERYLLALDAHGLFGG